MSMSRRAKFVLFALATIIAAIGAAAAGGTLWVHDRVQTTQYCATCHVISRYYDTWKNSGFTAHSHAQAGLACQDCHTRTTRDGLRELVANAVRSNTSPIKEHAARADECLRCHGSHEILAERTKSLMGPDRFPLGRNPHDSHWGPLECGTCHNMHKPSVDFCANCHGSPQSGAAWASPR